MSFTGELKGFQDEAFERMVRRKKVLVGYEMGLGKAQPVEAPVLTPNGWVPIGSLVVGDEVIGSDGRPTLVTGVFPQGHRPMMRVTFSDGAEVDCDPEHLWTVNSPQRRHRGAPSRVLKTWEIAKRLTDGVGNRQHFIPMVQPVEWTSVHLPLDPYLMGALLGDGSFAVARRVRFTTADEEMRLEIERLLPAGMMLKHEGGYDYSLIGMAWHQNPVLSTIRAFNIEGHRSEDKRVPDVYLYGSVEQRTALLQGLLDTDGHVRPKDNNVEFCTVSPGLAQDVQHLVQSLGGTARIREKPTSHQLAYRMSIALPAGVLPFRLSRKAAVYRERAKYPPSRSIVSVQPNGSAEAVCISVAAPDQLYVTKDFVVTHNTVITIAVIEHLMDQEKVGTCLVIVPSALKYQWLRSIKKFTDGAIAVVIDGTPTQRQRQYKEVMRGATEYVIMNYEQVVNDWEFVRHLPREAVVLDEATAIKNFAAKRTKRIKKLKAPYRFALSGQPIENRPEEVFSIMQWVDDTVLGRFDLFDRTFIVRDHWGKVKYYRQIPMLHETLAEAMVRKTRKDPDVRDQMPRVGEEIVEINFDTKGAALYRHIAADLLQELDAAIGKFGAFDLWSHYHGVEQAGEMQARGRIMSRLTCLRMLCDHPDLLRLSAAMYSASNDPMSASIKGGSQYAQALLEDGLLDAAKVSPKMKEAVLLVEELLEANDRNKVVLFAFFKDVLRMVQESTSHLTKSVLFTGDMSAKEKDAAKEQFEEDPDTRLFLSSDAGGYGVDLPNANYLISYDLPWSAGKLDQRNARIIRLSSEFEAVTLIYMLMSGSIEERQLAMLEQKQAIASAVVDGKGIDHQGRLNVDLKGLRQFLVESQV